MVVGIRARTTQLTSGSLASSFGFFLPQPPLATVESTGTERGRCCREGVCIPGVEGGVNAGETSPGRGASRSDS